MICWLPQYDHAADSRPSQLGLRWTPSTASCRTSGWRPCPKSQHDRTMSSCPSSCGVFMDWTACGEATSSHRREQRKFFYEPVSRALNSTREELSGSMLTFVRVQGKRKLSSSQNASIPKPPRGFDTYLVLGSNRVPAVAGGSLLDSGSF